MNNPFQLLFSNWRKKSGEVGANIGFSVHECSANETEEWNADTWFIPASNNKLWTTAVALDLLGPDYRWKTTCGVHEGTLWVKGGGDPVFTWDDVRKVAAELKANGVTILNKTALDDSLFVLQSRGSGWMWDDLQNGFAAPIHALNLERNRIPFQVDRTGPKPELKNPYPFIEAHTVSEMHWSDDDQSDYLIRRLRGSYQFEVTGKLSRTEQEVEIAVPSGPHFFAQALSFACQKEGIVVNPKSVRVRPVPVKWMDEAKVQITHYSPPLHKVLQTVNQESQNLVAEVLLRTLGLQAGGKGSVEAGKKCVYLTLQKWGLPLPGNYADGSGLSMYNLSSPRGMMQLLRFYAKHRYFSVFLDSLAQYGISGTLKNRTLSLPAGWDVRAKTGTVYGVKTLSGYLSYQGKICFIFSLMINGLLEEKHGEQLQDDFLQFLIGRNG
ncbi:D-alanyl-D-alanine carboxypeptidase/D-alanyl-D-alanine-endopeptidase [Paenactinomyces guangxiensis]|uniref:D-alanyl-D-alanine carboxypeptidase/D-alanyl-D-alanine-endopeptidase n=1 Tax=Paenactinomyces guangxiensis TaxID=1490290 RepID=A0A7W1WNS5_9BACL|nr:D-alanyl-D-alanine carboxypeptidase/D-alanyl-D-alanine-endopeptidase [Paenactinomyces guangxiensis]MBA4493211.1 D-alanyl-D-alanine carboxypeptidase/D-alanyl-D-alanine-endopeptidase [Paenactinomyces guangxiensis]MBH8589939.1 D-alanyl-D-alanine carboxypeptidase/D-alanyl-D-alanine-endopeptidase [Paenactinomyces guangxiensis]